MTPAAITLFPKRCHLHKAPMVWEDGRDDLASGWACPICKTVDRRCAAHRDPLRSGFGALYCRRCRLNKIKKDAAPSREAIAQALATRWHTMEDPGRAPGVAHIWRHNCDDPHR